jgi:Reverse transcriptase (RNA-dependent DNA polymerase)
VGDAEAPGEVGDAHASVATSDEDPLTYQQAMNGADATEWLAACAEELSSFEKLNVYEVVDRPSDRKVVDSKWVFKTKRGPDGEIVKHKARLVAKGFTQVPGLDYDETFAPVVKFATIRVLLAYAAHYDLEIHQIDVKTAFLHGNLKEEIYLKCPAGYDVGPNKVWKLRKSIYGLKQASREWYAKVSAEFSQLGFTRLHSDYAVFIKREADHIIIIGVYVDDMLMLSNGVAYIVNLKKQLSDKFELTDLGEVRWILNMEVTRDRARRTISLSQRQYIEDILARHDMSNCRPVSTPISANLKLLKLEAAESDTGAYQSQLGAVMYAMLGTRPDLAYAVTALSQHAATPGDDHATALTHVFRYLRKHTDVKLVFTGTTGPFALTGYVDADWANDINDRRSISGFVFLLAGGAISWCSRKQKLVAQSSTEAEYIAGALGTNEALWLRQLLSELGETQTEPTTLLIDNQAAIALAKNPVSHKQTKHIAVRFHHMRHHYLSQDIDPVYIPTGDQVADVLTKGLPHIKHSLFMNGMGLITHA